jgi:hypothetical protein
MQARNATPVLHYPHCHLHMIRESLHILRLVTASARPLWRRALSAAVLNNRLVGGPSLSTPRRVIVVYSSICPGESSA